jgi:hypothetical protein
MVTAAGTPQRCWAATAPGAIRLMNACCVRVPGVACEGAAYCRYWSDLAVADEEAVGVGAAALGVAVALGLAAAGRALGVADGREVGATAAGLAPGTAATPDRAPDESLAVGAPPTAEAPGITAACPRSSSACVPDPDPRPGCVVMLALAGWTTPGTAAAPDAASAPDAALAAGVAPAAGGAS